MADPISLASGVLTLVTFGLKASTSLYQTIKGYNSHQRDVRDLREEVESLTMVLKSLNEAAEEAEVDFTTLKLPLCRCGNACKEFEAIIIKCAGDPSGSRTSFRGWAKLKYMGDDIAGFKNMIAGYRSIITIALCDANLYVVSITVLTKLTSQHRRTSVVTTKVLNEYQEKIEDTMSDLNEHLSSVNEKLQTLLARKSSSTSESGSQWNELLSEQESIKQCMKICTDVAAHIDLVRPKIVLQTSRSDDHTVATVAPSMGSSAQRDTEQVLGRCKDDLSITFSQLNDRLEEITLRQHSLILQQKNSGEPEDEEATLQEEIDSVKQGLLLCAEASRKTQPDRTNTFEDISMTDDGQQVMVSTFGDLICARKIRAGARSVQLFGQMSDESLQQLSRRTPNGSKQNS
jgi:HPt (histidine-containing phosphotransfer) domain-containing protein